MRSNSDTYPDDSASDDAHRDPDEGETGSFFPYGWSLGPASWPYGAPGGDPYGDEAQGDRQPEADAYREDDGWWDEGLIGILLVGGVVLFFIPEPITTTVGILMLVVGVMAWMADALT